MRKVWIIRGIADDKQNKICDRMVSKCAWTTKKEALRALKNGDYDGCFDPYLEQVKYDAKHNALLKIN